MRTSIIKRYLTGSSAILFAVLSWGALFSEELGSNGETEFVINWDTYQYQVRTIMNINEAISLNERYYMRSQMKELILKKISTGVEGLYVDSSHRIMDILDENINFRREYPVYMQSINAIRLIFKKGNIEASTALPLRGEKGLLARIPVTWGTLRYESMNDPEYVGEAYNTSRVGRDYNANLVPIRYSGLIVDLRGMGFSEALTPRIYSQAGQLVYGPEFIAQKIGVQRGIIAYATDLNDPEVKIRAGNSPYYTVALASRGKFNTDVVLSADDVVKITQHPETIENLQKCRVVFIVDKKND